MLLAFVILVGLIPTTVLAGNPSTEELKSITITGVPMPQAGDKVSDYDEKEFASVSITTNPTGAVSGYDIDWYNEEGNDIPTETFVAGTTYSYRVAVKMANGYCCTKPTEIDAQLNGKKPDEIIWFASAWNGHTFNSFGVMNKYTIPDKPSEKTYDLTSSVNNGYFLIKSVDTPLLNKKDHAQYMIGYKDQTFRPDRQMSRQEVAVMFSRLLNERPQKGIIYSRDYKDVSDDLWSVTAISYMSAN